MTTSGGFVARHFRTGRWIRVVTRGRTIASVSEDGPIDPDVWVAPAFWDIQLNGRWGISFSDPELTVDQVARVVRDQAALGTARLCPTLITAPFESFLHGLKTIAAGCESDPDVDAMVAGVHLEGPYLSDLDGYRGAHPVASIRDPDWTEFGRFQEASGGRINLLTLAPERPGALPFIAKAVKSGVTVALGHTAADTETLHAAADMGASLSTHLGNGIAANLPRHPNPIWDQAANESLSASFIADGHHVDDATLKVLARAKTPARTILVSDASPLAGLAPGSYGPWSVDPSGKIVVAGTPYLAGSNQGLGVGVGRLLRVTGWSLPEAMATVTSNPARLLGRDEPTLRAGQPANLIVFRTHPEWTLLHVCVDGRWNPGGD